jgi:hypothetical protein
VLEPLLARELPGGALELLAGERRLEATKAAGLALVPVRVLAGLSDADARAIALTENLARKDLTAWEEAHALRQLRDARADAGLPVDLRTLAAQAGRDRTTTGHLLAVADRLTPAVVEAARGRCTGLVRIPDKLPLTLLYGAAQAPEEAERVRLLALAMGAVAPVPARPPRETRTPDAPVTLTTNKAGAVAVRFTQPVDTLTPEAAADALETLAPLLKALRARARSLTASPYAE